MDGIDRWIDRQIHGDIDSWLAIQLPRQVDRYPDRYPDRWIDRNIDRYMINTEIDRQIDRCISRQIGGQISRWKDRQEYKYTHGRYIDRLIDRQKYIDRWIDGSKKSVRTILLQLFGPMAASSFMPQDPQTSVKEEKFEAPVYAEEYLNYGDSPYLFPHVPLSPCRGQSLWLAMGRAYLRWIADARHSMACRYRQRLADLSGQRGNRSIAIQRIKESKQRF